MNTSEARGGPDEIEGTAERQSTDLSVKIELSCEKQRIETERHDYSLQVKLVNLGTEPLGPYHITLEMPARVVNCAHDQPLYVPDRSTPDVAFFRVTSTNDPSEIYPGDTKLVMSVNYYMDNDLYGDHVYLYEQPVRGTLYRSGVQPSTLERRFEEFQIF